MDSRALVAIAVGMTGLVLGFIALFDGGPIGLFAGFAALGAGVVGFLTARDLGKAEAAVEKERERADSLEASVASQVEARITAETAVASLGTELAATQASQADRTERIETDAREEAQSGKGNDRSVIVDPATGLFTEVYFRAVVEARVAAARRHLRPLAVVLIEVTEGSADGERKPANQETVADHILDTLRDSDTACQTSKGLYALVLEDTPENGAVWTVERIRRALTEESAELTLWAGVACYPAHAFEVRDLVGKASEALEAATEWHQDRIEVAVADI